MRAQEGNRRGSRAGITAGHCAARRGGEDGPGQAGPGGQRKRGSGERGRALCGREAPGWLTGGPSAGRWARRSGGRRARGGAAGAGRREVGLGCGPCGAGKRAGAREGVGRCGLGWVFFPILFLSSFLFLIQTNLTQMNPNLNLNSLKHSNKLNKMCTSMNATTKF